MRFRVLDAFQPLGGTWLGQVISSPSGPSGGPFWTRLLSGGRVPRVHGVQSPVPPRLPHFAAPGPVRYLATLVAGADPLGCPPNAWLPGAPALPGPCYWLGTSGTPMGWRRDCLAAGLVCSAVRHYCLGKCSALFVCAWRARRVRAGGRCRFSYPPVFCFPLPLRSPRCVLRVVPSRCPFPLPAVTLFHAVCSFRGLGPPALQVRPACPLLQWAHTCIGHEHAGTQRTARAHSSSVVAYSQVIEGIVIRFLHTHYHVYIAYRSSIIFTETTCDQLNCR